VSNYKKTIGIEVHCELKTNNKIFSPALSNYGSMANTNINIIDLGYPGSLPVLNMDVVRMALKACKVLNLNVTREMHFDRKNYFYPDLPKGFQITQQATPIGREGYVEITKSDGTKKKIYIEEMHIEEDTCKSVHGEKSSLLDFNRAGVPLIEIVTKPCMESSEEAVLYLEKLRELLLYAEVSDCKIEEGSMRCDTNVSISKTDILGTKVETKNKTYLKGNSKTGTGYVYVFDIDKTSSYTVDSHSNLISIYNYGGKNNDAIYFSDVYVDSNNIDGNVIIQKSTGIDGIEGTYIPNNTVVKIDDKNCYVKVGVTKKFMKNISVKLTKVSQEEGKNGTATFSFNWE